MKLLNFENWVSGELSKIGHHFRNKVTYLKVDVIKKMSIKKCGPKLRFFNEKDSDDF